MLSLFTMPESLLVALLNRSTANLKQRRAILREWQTRREHLQATLENGFVYECAPLPDEDALLEGSVPAEIPGLTLFYTPQEFCAHVKAIRDLAETSPGYHFVPLPDAPFLNTKILVTNTAVLVSRLTEPRIIFTFDHPALCRAFMAYAEALKAPYLQEEEGSLREMEKYL